MECLLVFLLKIKRLAPVAKVKYEFNIVLLQITNFDQPTDQETKKKRGFCFITFEDEEAVNKAMTSQYHYIGDEQVGVGTLECTVILYTVISAFFHWVLFLCKTPLST